jgi:hypothetical protein
MNPRPDRTLAKGKGKAAPAADDEEEVSTLPRACMFLRFAPALFLAGRLIVRNLSVARFCVG